MFFLLEKFETAIIRNKRVKMIETIILIMVGVLLWATRPKRRWGENG